MSHVGSGSQDFGPSSTFFPGHEQIAGQEVEQLRLKQILRVGSQQVQRERLITEPLCPPPQLSVFLSCKAACWKLCSA